MRGLRGIERQLNERPSRRRRRRGSAEAEIRPGNAADPNVVKCLRYSHADRGPAASVQVINCIDHMLKLRDSDIAGRAVRRIKTGFLGLLIIAPAGGLCVVCRQPTD